MLFVDKLSSLFPGYKKWPLSMVYLIYTSDVTGLNFSKGIMSLRLHIYEVIVLL